MGGGSCAFLFSSLCGPLRVSVVYLLLLLLGSDPQSVRACVCVCVRVCVRACVRVFV